MIYLGQFKSQNCRRVCGKPTRT